MKLSDIGERKAIDLISKNLNRGDTAVWIGDDCAALDFDDKYLLITTDMINEKTHISKEMKPFQIGWFIVAINLSDIAAKGGKPIGLTLALGLPSNTSDIFLKELMKGADACAKQYKTSIIGGDTKENDILTICGTSFGVVKKDFFMARKGTKPKDIVAVTGTIGGAGAGYYSIQHKIKDTSLKKILFEPKPKIYEGIALAKEKIITTSMDLSDGLSSSLYQLQKINKVGFEIDLDRLPISPLLLKLQKQHKINTLQYALHFGGDYELLLTMPSDKFQQAKKTIEKTGNTLTNIGIVTKKKEILQISNGNITKLENKGFEHFKSHIF